MSAKRYFPNLLSLVRIVLTPLIVIFLCRTSPWIVSAIIVFTIAVLTDFYDGYFARKHALTSRTGDFLDPLADKVLVLSTFTVFWYLALLPLWMLVIILLREFLVTGLRFVMDRRGKALKTSMFGKWKTVVQFIAMYALFFNLWQVSWMTQTFLSSILYGAILITGFSGIHYFVKNKSVFLSRARARHPGC